MKRLALFLDGTWNNVDDNTNVWRLRSLIAEVGKDGVPQRPYYSTGVGTAKGEKIRGGGLGYGVSPQIIKAYRWLIENYDEGDEIYVFGFSRGAFTARSLVGFIARCGLLRPGAPLSVSQVYDRYRLHKAVRPIYKIKFLHDYPKSSEAKANPITPEEKRLLDYSMRVPIRMIGVWDTVGALGVPFGRLRGLSRQSFYFHNTNLSKIFEHAFHALAIDEHRKAFQETLWTLFSKEQPTVPTRPPEGQVVEQRWFVGAHANVGGGIVDDEVAQVPLAWLKGKAEGLGLAFRFPVPLAGKEHLGPVTDSFRAFMGGFYRWLKLFRRHHRKVGGPPRQVKGGWSDSVNETIDSTVFERWQQDAAYRPQGLLEWKARLGFDPASLTTAVDARTGRAVP